jgi:hypothetical protein
VLSNRTIRRAALTLIVIGVGLAVMLLIAFGNGQHSDGAGHGVAAGGCGQMVAMLVTGGECVRPA